MSEIDKRRLRALLSVLGLSQRAVARELGVSDRTMRYWCAGQPIPKMAFMALEYLRIHKVETMGCECRPGKPRLDLPSTHAHYCPVWKAWYLGYLKMSKLLKGAKP